MNNENNNLQGGQPVQSPVQPQPMVQPQQPVQSPVQPQPMAQPQQPVQSPVQPQPMVQPQQPVQSPVQPQPMAQPQQPVQSPVQPQPMVQPQQPVQSPVQPQPMAQPQQPVQSPVQPQPMVQPQQPVQSPVQPQQPMTNMNQMNQPIPNNGGYPPIQPYKSSSNSKVILIVVGVVLLAVILIFIFVPKGNKKGNSNSNSNSNQSNISNSSSNVSNSNSQANNSNVNSQSNSNTSSNKTFAEKEVSKIDKVEWSYTPIDFNNLQWVKSKRYGNIKVPATWKEDVETYNSFKQLGTDMEYVIYMSPDSTESLIMMDVPVSSGKFEIESTVNKMAEDVFLESYASEKATIDGKNVAIIIHKLHTKNKILVDFFVTHPDGKTLVHICLESRDPKVQDLVKTFTFNDPK